MLEQHEICQHHATKEGSLLLRRQGLVRKLNHVSVGIGTTLRARVAARVWCEFPNDRNISHYFNAGSGARNRKLALNAQFCSATENAGSMHGARWPSLLRNGAIEYGKRWYACAASRRLLCRANDLTIVGQAGCHAGGLVEMTSVYVHGIQTTVHTIESAWAF